MSPVLPKAWPNGRITGFRARGGFEIDIEWENGTLKDAKIKFLNGKNAVIRYGDITAFYSVSSGQSLHLNLNLKKQ